MAEIKVSGMSCDHCVRAVTSELEEIPGVSSVKVALSDSGPATVSFDDATGVSQEALAAAIDEAGYELV